MFLPARCNRNSATVVQEQVQEEKQNEEDEYDNMIDEKGNTASVLVTSTNNSHRVGHSTMLSSIVPGPDVVDSCQPPTLSRVVA